MSNVTYYRIWFDEVADSLHDLISSLYSVDHADRYVYRAAP